MFRRAVSDALPVCRTVHHILPFGSTLQSARSCCRGMYRSTCRPDRAALRNQIVKDQRGRQPRPLARISPRHYYSNAYPVPNLCFRKSLFDTVKHGVISFLECPHYGHAAVS